MIISQEKRASFLFQGLVDTHGNSATLPTCLSYAKPLIRKLYQGKLIAGKVGRTGGMTR